MSVYLRLRHKPEAQAKERPDLRLRFRLVMHANDYGEPANMREFRRRLLTAAGMGLLAASPALAQVPGVPNITPLTDDPPPGVPSPVVKPAQQRTVLPDPLIRIETLPTPTRTLPPITAPTPTVEAPAASVYHGPVAAPVCEGQTTAADDRWFWERWRAGRDQHHVSLQGKMWGYPEEFEAPPLGHFVKSHFRTMVANGEIAQMVLYRYDFVEGQEFLNLHGRDQLVKIANAVSTIHAPIIIERTPDCPQLAEMRRHAVLNVLLQNGVPVTPERIVIGVPIPNGLSGVEAALLEGRSLENMRIQSTPIPAVGSSGGAFGSSIGGSSSGGAGGGSGGSGSR
jgi:hypothetical protein